MTGTLSTMLGALAESIARGLEGKPDPTPSQVYAKIIRARDEAVCLEARAGARDAAVHRLLADITSQCGELARIAATPGLLQDAERQEGTMQ